MLEASPDAKRILGVNDLRGTPLVDGKPSDLFGMGLVLGFADAASLGIADIDPDSVGSLSVDAMGTDEATIDCITREFRHRGVSYRQRAVDGDTWGAWQSVEWDREEYAHLHREQQFTEPQHFGQAIFERVVDLGDDAEIDIRKGAIFKKTITHPTQFALASDFIDSLNSFDSLMATFSLHLENGGVEEVLWWDGLIWPDGEPPTLTVAGIDLFGFITINGGSTWLGVTLGQNYK